VTLTHTTPRFIIPVDVGKDAHRKALCTDPTTCMPDNLTVTLTPVGNGSPDFDKAHGELIDSSTAPASPINKTST